MEKRAGLALSSKGLLMDSAACAQAMAIVKDAEQYKGWLKAIAAPVLVAAGDKDLLTPLVSYPCYVTMPCGGCS
jgi:pimeloyl-ACP methyl ester carboxylesterase